MWPSKELQYGLRWSIPWSLRSARSAAGAESAPTTNTCSSFHAAVPLPQLLRNPARLGAERPGQSAYLPRVPVGACAVSAPGSGHMLRAPRRLRGRRSRALIPRFNTAHLRFYASIQSPQDFRLLRLNAPTPPAPRPLLLEDTRLPCRVRRPASFSSNISKPHGSESYGAGFLAVWKTWKKQGNSS